MSAIEDNVAFDSGKDYTNGRRGSAMMSDNNVTF